MARNRRESVYPSAGPYNQVGLDSSPDRLNSLARATGTVAGNAATLLLSTRKAGAVRSGVLIHNASSTWDLWLRLMNYGDDAPTISTTDKDFVVLVGETLFIECGSDIEIYAQNSSGAATTSNYCASEVAR